jgi:hypothetical protein
MESRGDSSLQSFIPSLTYQFNTTSTNKHGISGNPLLEIPPSIPTCTSTASSHSTIYEHTLQPFYQYPAYNAEHGNAEHGTTEPYKPFSLSYKHYYQTSSHETKSSIPLSQKTGNEKTYAKPSPQQKKLNSSRRVAQRRKKRKLKHLTKTKDLPSLQAAYHLKK